MHNMSCNYLKVNEQQLELSGRQAPSVHRKIPGSDSNTDTGICENKTPVFMYSTVDNLLFIIF